MNERGNITLNQKAFNRLIAYLHKTNSYDAIQWLKETRGQNNNICLVVEYNEQGDIFMAAIDKTNLSIVPQYVLSCDSPIEASKIQDILFHSEQRVEDWE